MIHSLKTSGWNPWVWPWLFIQTYQIFQNLHCILSLIEKDSFILLDLGNKALDQGLSSKILQRASSCILQSVSHSLLEIDHPHIVKVRINFTLGKAHARQETIYSSIPSSGSLFQAIEGLLQLAYVSPSIFNFKSL